MERYFDAGLPRSPVRRKIYQLSQQSNLLKSSIQREINLDGLPHDGTDQKRIWEYTQNPKKQVDILTRGCYRPPSKFVYRHRDIEGTYINNERANERFANLDEIADLAKLMVQTNKHVTFLGLSILKLVLVYIASCHNIREETLSVLNVVSEKMYNKMGDQFMSNCLIFYVQKSHVFYH